MAKAPDTATTGYITGKELCAGACGLRLIRFTATKTFFCETVIFVNGRSAVLTTLNRAGIAGRVEIEGEVGDYQADIMTDGGNSMEQHVALDAKSYRALKNRWLRCKVEAVEPT